MSIWRAETASLSSAKRPSCMIPALLISASSGPSWASVSSRKRSNDSRSVTSSGSASVPPPSSSAVRSASSTSRSPIATRAPLRTSAAAVARPIPRAPPVIATTLPVSERGCLAMADLLRAGGGCGRHELAEQPVSRDSARRASGDALGTPRRRVCGAPSARPPTSIRALMATAHLACLDGAVMPAADAVVPATDEGLLRGDGVFEVLRLYGGRPFALDAHLARLGRSAENLRLPLDLPAVRADVARLLDAAGGQPDPGCLRIVVTRGGRRLLLTESLPAHAPAIRLAGVTYAPVRLL